MKLLIFLLSLSLLLVGCGDLPITKAQPPAAEAVIETVPPETQWVQFGTVEWVSDATLTGKQKEPEKAMKLSIRMDTGEDLTLVQSVAQAGRFNVGDRVRVLHIGEFTRVTYWPYQSYERERQGPGYGE